MSLFSVAARLPYLNRSAGNIGVNSILIVLAFHLKVAARLPYLNRSAGKIGVNRILKQLLHRMSLITRNTKECRSMTAQ